jgi:hypothetical protein
MNKLKHLNNIGSTSARLICRQIEVRSLTDTMITAMFELLCSHFYNVTWQAFEHDLQSKDIVFLLEEVSTGALVGFSTQLVMRASSGSRVVFSGDTIVDPNSWGSLALAKAWGVWMLSLYEQEPSSPLYWMLISKGHRTFRFLPTYFIDFAPAHTRGYSELELILIRDIGDRLFNEKLRMNDLGYMVVEHTSTSQHLKEHLLDDRHLQPNQPNITFFAKANPDYTKGTELVCLTKFCISNMKPFCRRMLGLSLMTKECDA